jgi:transposase-like protein
MTTDTAIAGSERRRWTTAQKLKVVSESLPAQASVTEVARRHGLNPNLIHRWRRQAKNRFSGKSLKLSLDLRWLQLLPGAAQGLL